MRHVVIWLMVATGVVVSIPVAWTAYQSVEFQALWFAGFGWCR